MANKKVRAGIRRKIIELSYQLQENQCGDIKHWRKIFWTIIGENLTKKERAFLKEHPEFIRECLFDDFDLDSDTAKGVTLEFLLDKARW